MIPTESAKNNPLSTEEKLRYAIYIAAYDIMAEQNPEDLTDLWPKIANVGAGLRGFDSMTTKTVFTALATGFPNARDQIVRGLPESMRRAPTYFIVGALLGMFSIGRREFDAKCSLVQTGKYNLELRNALHRIFSLNASSAEVLSKDHGALSGAIGDCLWKTQVSDPADLRAMVCERRQILLGVAKDMIAADAQQPGLLNPTDKLNGIVVSRLCSELISTQPQRQLFETVVSLKA